MNEKDRPLEGQVAVIIGGGRGIGAAIAKAYAQAGAFVCCAARTLEEIEEVSRDIANSGGKSLAIQMDVKNQDSVESLYEKMVAVAGGIDILVYSAGINKEPEPVEEVDSGKWRDVIETNLFGAFNCIKSVIPYLKKRGGGKIITLGSIYSHKSSKDRSAYCCSKAGLWMLTNVLADELREFNICVNELSPGPVRTKMSSGPRTYPGQWVKYPEEVAPLALFLATQPKNGPTGQSYSLYQRPSLAIY